MRYLIILFMSLTLYCSEEDTNISTVNASSGLNHMSVKEKKKRFIKLLLPSVRHVHDRLMQRYETVSNEIQNKTNTQAIQKLKQEYKAQSDEDLLSRLKPHPISITLAQAAMESSWATSRIFLQAKNIFGMWSSHPKQQRIAAKEKRAGKYTVWLRKFDTIDDSVGAYYEMIAKGKVYNKFRQLRLQYSDPYKITPGLDKYSEMGSAYVTAINNVIKYNKFTKYDK